MTTRFDTPLEHFAWAIKVLEEVPFGQLKSRTPEMVLRALHTAYKELAKYEGGE